MLSVLSLCERCIPVVIFFGEIQVFDAQCDMVAHAGLSIIGVAEIKGLENLGVGLQRILGCIGQRKTSVSKAHHGLLHQLKDVDEQLVSGQLYNCVVKIALFQ